MRTSRVEPPAVVWIPRLVNRRTNKVAWEARVPCQSRDQADAIAKQALATTPAFSGCESRPRRKTP